MNDLQKPKNPEVGPGNLGRPVDTSVDMVAGARSGVVTFNAPPPDPMKVIKGAIASGDRIARRVELFQGAVSTPSTPLSE